MELATTTTNEILNHHLNTFLEGNMVELMKDYAETSSVLSPMGEFTGLAAIETFFSEVFKMMPPGSTTLNVQQTIFREDLAYIAWNAESPYVSIPAAADTFIMKDDKIAVQTIGAHIIPKN